MGSETPMTDAFYANKVVQITPEAVGDFLRECQAHARKFESALAAAEEALRGIDHGFCSHRQTVREAQRRCREALRAIEKIKGGE